MTAYVGLVVLAAGSPEGDGGCRSAVNRAARWLAAAARPGGGWGYKQPQGSLAMLAEDLALGALGLEGSSAGVGYRPGQRTPLCQELLEGPGRRPEAARRDEALYRLRPRSSRFAWLARLAVMA